jgi:hypothetical protein
MQQFFIFSSLIFLSISQFVFTLPTQAHSLISQDNIAVVVHINPNDDPVAQEETQIYFSVSDTSKSFQSKYCQCKVLVQENGKTVFEKSLPRENMVSDTAEFVAVYTFEKPIVYTVSLEGESINTSFDSFTFSQDIRVKHASTQSNIGQYTVYGLVAIGALLTILLFTKLQKYFINRGI